MKEERQSRSKFREIFTIFVSVFGKLRHSSVANRGHRTTTTGTVFVLVTSLSRLSQYRSSFFANPCNVFRKAGSNAQKPLLGLPFSISPTCH